MIENGGTPSPEPIVSPANNSVVAHSRGSAAGRSSILFEVPLEISEFEFTVDNSVGMTTCTLAFDSLGIGYISSLGEPGAMTVEYGTFVLSNEDGCCSAARAE